jgi:riboflavin synthase
MFTGLVESVGTIVEITPQKAGVLLAVSNPELFADVAIGDSISINGCCLTVVSISDSKDAASFEAGTETLSRTNLGQLGAGGQVNLERSLRVGDRMGGHFVTGHIDCVGAMKSRTDDGDWSTIWFSIPHPYGRHLASKGSIAVDGVSLTLVDVKDDAFSVALIPHTLDNTVIGAKSVGDPVNLETDVLAKYVEQSLRFNN